MKKAHEMQAGGLNVLHHHGPVRLELPTEKELASLPKSDLDKLQEAVRTDKASAIKHFQKILNAFPWAELGKPKPNLPIDGKYQGKTKEATEYLIELGKDLNEANLNRMAKFVEAGDFFNAQSVAYVAKSELVNALHQFQKTPPELVNKYPGLRKWTMEEMRDYMRNSPYPSYFPKPWSLSRLGKRTWQGTWDCEGNNCMQSYYDNFMRWGPPKQIGAGTAYDPRLFRNMDKYPNIWSNRAIRFRMQKNIPSPHIPSPGTGHWMDINNLPPGKRFLDEEDKAEYFRLLKLYEQFVKEEKERGSAYIPPPGGNKVAKLSRQLIKRYYLD
jgi:hypothetical protein